MVGKKVTVKTEQELFADGWEQGTFNYSLRGYSVLITNFKRKYFGKSGVILDASGNRFKIQFGDSIEYIAKRAIKSPSLDLALVYKGL